MTDAFDKFRTYLALRTHVNILTDRLANMADISAQARVALREGEQSKAFSLLWLIERDLPNVRALCRSATILDSVNEEDCEAGIA